MCAMLTESDTTHLPAAACLAPRGWPWHPRISPGTLEALRATHDGSSDSAFQNGHRARYARQTAGASAVPWNQVLRRVRSLILIAFATFSHLLCAGTGFARHLSAVGAAGAGRCTRLRNAARRPLV
ncbi:hypothetical protein BV25DRAFT_776920 [Artomyces pyxidatus]|uniref:Uncharacterized protein n=1 Tax=Artomyces pyxidatus TaxID=48021 RepID=A0ACB8SZN2_9AGAM|nr:hypothetical protein BV25DRAFT_776920 [Artomyces pyxidatus]